ncbi:MAG: ABC transporter permease [Gemmatimonadales bacterium]|nr:MAG: ABC transporter permease [Gemmatimonadales bacterium]
MNSFRKAARWFHGLKEGVRIALDSVGANPFRSGLTILGIAIGVAVVVIMAAMITGIRSSVAEGIESAGPRNFFVTRFDITDIRLVNDGSAPDWLRRPPVTVEETRRAAALPAVRTAAISFPLQDPGAEGGITLTRGTTRIAGIAGSAESDTWMDYQDVEFVAGRNFTSFDVAEASPVVVISEPLARDLFGEDPSRALGERVRARAGNGSPLPLSVVGIFQMAPNLFQEASGHMAVIPYSTGLRRLGIDDEWGQMIVVPRDEVDQAIAEDQVIALLRSMRGLQPAQDNDFSILRSTQLLEFFDQFTGVFFIVMLALSSVGLLVGGVGVVGIMLISVTERTREIGIRKALGATRIEILWQFLVEAGMLTLLGGALGLMLGGGLAGLVALATPIPASIPLWAIVAALGMAALTGMLFGLIPAARAARMDPVEAFRYE